MYIIDIREKKEYNVSHIPNAIWISKIDLVNQPEKYLLKNNKYLIYCNKGNSSVEIKNYLRRKGYIVNDIVGGYNNYLKNKSILKNYF